MKRFDDDQLRAIYERTNGNCHLCSKRLAFKNYGCDGERGAWEVDHSRARARGGSDHGNNLFAAHIRCNRSKGAMTSRTVRASYGLERAPLSKRNVAKSRTANTIGGVVAGALLGGAIGMPFIGATIGGAIGHSTKVK